MKHIEVIQRRFSDNTLIMDNHVGLNKIGNGKCMLPVTKTTSYYLNMFHFCLAILFVIKLSKIFINHAPKDKTVSPCASATDLNYIFAAL